MVDKERKVLKTNKNHLKNVNHTQTRKRKREENKEIKEGAKVEIRRINVITHIQIQVNKNTIVIENKNMIKEKIRENIKDHAKKMRIQFKIIIIEI